MKQNKTLGVLAIAFTLMLSACAGGGGGSSEESVHKHTWGEWVVTTPATCTEAGARERTCTVCSEKQTGTVAALGHTWGDWVTTLEATCTEVGSRQHTCSVCQTVATEEVAALGHDWGEETVVTAPGVGIEGVGSHTCNRCQLTEATVIAALSPNITIDAAALQKDENGKVSIVISGTEQYFTEENFLWAFGLKTYGAETWLTGKAAPEDADYNYPVEIEPDPAFPEDATKGIYTVAFDLTDIVVPEGVDKADMFNVYAGPKGLYATFPSISLAPGNCADNAHNYYFRNDSGVGSVFSVCCDSLPPYFHFADAMIEFRGETNLAWVKIYGEALDQEADIATLQATLDALAFTHRYQSQSNTMTTPTTEQRYFEVLEVEGKIMVYFNVNINFMVEGSNTVYNTHLNLVSGTKYANCVMEGDFSHVYDIPGTTRTLEVFSHPAGENNVQNSYGNLGFRTADAVVAAE